MLRLTSVSIVCFLIARFSSAAQSFGFLSCLTLLSSQPVRSRNARFGVGGSGFRL